MQLMFLLSTFGNIAVAIAIALLSVLVIFVGYGIIIVFYGASAQGEIDRYFGTTKK